MDIPVASWVLSLVTFLLGTAVPFIYRRVTFDGLAIAPLDIRAIRGPSDPARTSLMFGTMLRIANVTGRSVMIDAVRVQDISLKSRRYQMTNCLLADVTESREVHIPIWQRDVSQVLPLILKQDTVTVLALQIEFDTDTSGVTDAQAELAAILERPFPIRFRVNGVYRNYEIDLTKPQPVFGYAIRIGVSEPEETPERPPTTGGTSGPTS